jgi:hypothetical protein
MSDVNITVQIKIVLTNSSGGYSSTRTFTPQSYGPSRSVKLQELIHFFFDALKKDGNYSDEEVSGASQRILTGIDPKEDPITPKLPFPKEFARASADIVLADDEAVGESLDDETKQRSKVFGQLLMEGKFFIQPPRDVKWDVDRKVQSLIWLAREKPEGGPAGSEESSDSEPEEELEEIEA